jgi:hypothetical protein
MGPGGLGGDFAKLPELVRKDLRRRDLRALGGGARESSGACGKTIRLGPAAGLSRGFLAKTVENQMIIIGLGG